MQPPTPLHGVVATSIASEGLLAPTLRPDSTNTWWSRRWIQALDSFGGLGGFGRGRSQARRETVLAHHLEPGIVLAQVQSGKTEPFIVRCDVPPLSHETWDAVISGMAQKAVFAAKLLAGEMPEETEEAFAEARATLLPQSPADVPSSCTCGEPVSPCRHVAAVHYLLAEELGRDPFLLFKLRGCPKEQLLAALRQKRSGSGAPVEEAEAADEAVSPHAFWHAGAALDRFAINIAPPMSHAGLLKQLGPPPVEAGESFLDVMAALYQRVMESVLEEALKGQRPTAATLPDSRSSGEGSNGRREGGQS